MTVILFVFFVILYHMGVTFQLESLLVKKTIMMIGQDEAIMKQNSMSLFVWTLPDGYKRQGYWYDDFGIL